jgi:UDP-N-acetylglucosamine--N-acetylmuramyl-(pentapeptide) pyrophosphoryl-undecaprenol N-acetylglucosamine transferase
MLTTSTKIRIALTGGGTGGHVYPLVATMEAMQAYVQQGYNIEFHYFGARDAWSEEVLGRGAQFHRIAAGKWRRYFSLLNLFDIPKIIWAFWQALWKMFFVMPDALFSKGGPGAWPVVVAAWFYRIPVVIHESDAVPGLTSLLSAPFSRRIALGFESAGHYFNPKKIVTTGNPVRQSLLEKRLEQTAAKTELGFLPNRPLLVVIGGSQGAQALNEFILLNLKSILPIAQVYHQTGKANFMDVEKLSQAALLEVPAGAEAGSRYKAVPYLDDRTAGLGFSAADLILARAGAGSIAEFAAFGRPMVLVPLQGHQEENAAAVQASGGARIIEQTNLTERIFASTLRGIVENADVKSKMSEAVQKLYRPDAAKNLAELILGLT